jgi:hypothetical protein
MPRHSGTSECLETGMCCGDCVKDNVDAGLSPIAEDNGGTASTCEIQLY